MRTLIDFSLLKEYNDEVQPRGDRLLELAKLVDWNAFKRFEVELYKNKSERGSRPNIDIIIMIKHLLWHPKKWLLKLKMLTWLLLETANRSLIEILYNFHSQID